jgi:hypothetical protein
MRSALVVLGSTCSVPACDRGRGRRAARRSASAPRRPAGSASNSAVAAACVCPPPGPLPVPISPLPPCARGPNLRGRQRENRPAQPSRRPRNLEARPRVAREHVKNSGSPSRTNTLPGGPGLIGSRRASRRPRTRSPQSPVVLISRDMFRASGAESNCRAQRPQARCFQPRTDNLHGYLSSPPSATESASKSRSCQRRFERARLARPLFVLFMPGLRYKFRHGGVPAVFIAAHVLQPGRNVRNQGSK